MSDYTIRIEGGHVSFVWDDALAELCDEGTTHVERVSHVEPAPGGWTADMNPVGGPVLGPFTLRGEALAAERAWLAANKGL